MDPISSHGSLQLEHLSQLWSEKGCDDRKKGQRDGNVAGFEDGGKGCKPRHAGNSGKGRKVDGPLAPPERNMALLRP